MDVDGPPPPLLHGAGAAPGVDIRNLIMTKERELQDMNEYRIRALESAIKDKEAALGEERGKIVKLKEDFSYNLKLIEDRDEELQRYDATFEGLKAAIKEKEAEAAELERVGADQQASLRQQETKWTEQEEYYQGKLKEGRELLDTTRWQREDDARRLRETFEAAKRDLERQLRERAEDMENQRREMSLSFDGVLRQREAEAADREEQSRRAAADAGAAVEARDKELELLKGQECALRARGGDLQAELDEAEQKARGVSWELQEAIESKDGRIQDLEGQLEEAKVGRQSILDEYEGKMAELLQSLHAVERAFMQQREQYEAQARTEEMKREEDTRATVARLEERLHSVTRKLAATEEALEGSSGTFKQTKWEYVEEALKYSV